MKITKIEQQKNNPHRVNIFADNCFFSGLDIEFLVSLSLKVGDEITPETERAVREQNALSKCLRKALSLLNYRDRTTYELKKKLLEHKFDEKEIDYTVSRLVSEKYIDDDNFISSYINYHKSSASKAKIIQKLWRLGIPNELIQTKINEIYPEDEEYSSCLQAMTNKLRSPSCDREKLIRHLMYKGYKYSTVSQVLRDHFPQEKN